LQEESGRRIDELLRDRLGRDDGLLVLDNCVFGRNCPT
jgi:hypothetical protein